MAEHLRSSAPTQPRKMDLAEILEQKSEREQHDKPTVEADLGKQAKRIKPSSPSVETYFKGAQTSPLNIPAPSPIVKEPVTSIQNSYPRFHASYTGPPIRVPPVQVAPPSAQHVQASPPSAQSPTSPDGQRTFFDPARNQHVVTPEVKKYVPKPRPKLAPKPINPPPPPAPQDDAFSDSATTSPSVTSTSSRSSSNSRYRLSILQQPAAARACGLGERDRRVVDPPPIVQLTMENFDPQSDEDQIMLKQPSNIVHCTLLSVPQGRDVSATRDPLNPQRLQRRLMGTQAASCFIGTDPNISSRVPEDMRPGVYFIFSDVSCRHTGRFRLKFDMMNLSAHTSELGTQAMILASAISDVFEVFNAKDFPGMKPSSALARELRRQGANIPIKKGVDCVYGARSKRRNRNDSDEGMSDG